VTFKDYVVVNDDLAAGNLGAVYHDILGLSASGGDGEPEASDEALNTVINGLDEADRDPGQQFGDFDGRFRSDALKVAFIITDAHPGGFDDVYTPGVDDVHAHLMALEAQAAGIKIGSIFVPTNGDADGSITAIMKDYAITTGGLYQKTRSDGSNTASAIENILAKLCGA
jgi:hypothetical protein